MVVHADEPREGALRIALPLEGSPRRWLVPGVYYDGGGLPVRSEAWSFRADRISHPAAFGWSDRELACLATEEVSELGPAGVGFAGGELQLTFPGRDEPVSVDGSPSGGAAFRPLVRLAAGERRAVRFRLLLAAATPHGYDALLRVLYDALSSVHPLSAELPALDEVAALAAEGLLNWHFRPDQAVLAEAVPFVAGAKGGREEMHSAWLSGAPTAYALLPHAPDAANAVLDKVAAGLAPCGLPWGRWTPSEGWRSGWTPPGTLHSRTAAEAVLFLARAGRRGALHAALSWACGTQRHDGALPSLIDTCSGAGLAWEGAAGLTWAAVLAEAGELDAARRAGDYYSRFLEEGLLWGAPEDVHCGVSSEDGYAAVMAYVALYEATAEDRWLDLARCAAGWAFTFRFAYNLTWPQGSLLDRQGFRSRGADLASPQNQHLHAYGLIALPEMLKLWRATGDRHVLLRTRDNLACFLQSVARFDGDFGARRGMATERFYNTDCFGTKGDLLPLSHAWCLGLLLLACNEARRFADDLDLTAPSGAL